MKLYVYDNGLTMVGKPWQIKAKLKELQKEADSLQSLLSKHQRVFEHKKRRPNSFTIVR
jgi:hypothetical protein